jgi:hypothetical protein
MRTLVSLNDISLGIYDICSEGCEGREVRFVPWVVTVVTPPTLACAGGLYGSILG